MYLFLCDFCHFKKIDNKLDGFLEVSSNQTSPKLTEKKTWEQVKIKQHRKFKCPNCGRLIVIRLIKENETKIDETGHKSSFEGQSFS